MFLFLGRKRKEKRVRIDEERIGNIVDGKLANYVKSEDLRRILEDIEKDKRKKQLWDSLPFYKKKKLLEYLGKKHGKKETL